MFNFNISSSVCSLPLLFFKFSFSYSDAIEEANEDNKNDNSNESTDNSAELNNSTLLLELSSSSSPEQSPDITTTENE